MGLFRFLCIVEIVSQEKENMNKVVDKIEGKKTSTFVEITWFVALIVQLRKGAPRDYG